MTALPPLVLYVACLAPLSAADSYVFPFAQAQVLNDVGRQGNIRHGNLIDPGDEIGWTLAGLPAAAYRVELEVRTGVRGEGTSFIPSYHMNAPAHCFLPGRQRELGFSLSADSTPTITLRGKNWAVFRGRITAEDSLLLRAGDQLCARSTAHHANVYRLVLTRLSGRDLVRVDLDVKQYASLFVEGDAVSVTASALNFGGQAFQGAVAFDARDEHARVVAQARQQVSVPAKSCSPVVWRPDLPGFGPFFIEATLTDDRGTLASDAICLGVVPRIDLRTVPDTSSTAREGVRR